MVPGQTAAPLSPSDLRSKAPHPQVNPMGLCGNFPKKSEQLILIFSDYSAPCHKRPSMRRDGQASMKALETVGKIGHGFLHRSREVQRQHGGTAHDPHPPIPQAPAGGLAETSTPSQAASCPKGT